jgi:hypothetical protein
VLGVFLTNVELPSVSGYGHGLLGYNAKWFNVTVGSIVKA